MNISRSTKGQRRRSTARRASIAVGAAVAAAVALTSCSLSPSASGSDSNTLTVAIWKGYGADLPWVATDFKKETGATLKFQYIDSESNELQLVNKANGGIDVALPNIQYIGQGIDQGIFHELDTSKLTNYSDFYPEFSGRKEIRKDGKLYGVPWTWGSTGLFFDGSKVTPTPDSLSVLWDPKYKGQIALIDDATVLVPITALYLGEDPQNPDMAKVTPALQKLKDNAKLLYSSTDDLAKGIASGSIVAGIANSDGIGGLIAGNAPGTSNFKYEITKEGAVGWIDNWAIAAKTQHLDLAYKWLNYMTGKDFLTKWANTPADSSPAPANKSVVASLEPATLDRLQANPDKISSLALQLPQPADRLQSWVDAWTQVKAGS
ncbi:ABC transporter substrate-binding protein [Leifsonia shinshuensis]|uniref:ABC transporter substrate-binding protein n=1 Tax=Leifsonia shinshuensis TaxID=150026 RepID=UPI0016250859|nr:extracellular solute-binding protein [Leifsonia shinshuensis]